MDWLLLVQIGPKEVILPNGLVAVGSDWAKKGDTIKMDWFLSVQIGPKEVILSNGLVAR